MLWCKRGSEVPEAGECKEIDGVEANVVEAHGECCFLLTYCSLLLFSSSTAGARDRASLGCG